MIETVRRVRPGSAGSSGEHEAIRRAHAAYCLVLAEEGNAATAPVERDEWLTLCDVEHENFRAALDYVIAGDHAEWAQRLGVALHAFWDRQDRLAEGRARLEAILALGGAKARRDPAWAEAACYTAGLASVQGDYDAMRRSASRRTGRLSRTRQTTRASSRSSQESDSQSAAVVTLPQPGTGSSGRSRRAGRLVTSGGLRQRQAISRTRSLR